MRQFSPAEFDVPALRKLALELGQDEATRLLYEAILASPAHGPFIDRVNAALAAPAALAETELPRDITLVIVPGLLYHEFPKTGADGKRFIDLIAAMGLPTQTIPVKSAGTLEENARIIADFLAANRSRKLILLSFSKGSADIKTALNSPALAPAFTDLHAWISVGGILSGTPLISWLRQHRFRRALVKAWFRFHRLPYTHIESLDHAPGTPLAAPLILPAHLQLIHLIAFPRTADIRMPLARRAYRRLNPLGPNDAGGLLLGDLASWPGTLYPLANTDHYLRTCPNLPAILRAILIHA